MAQDYHVESSLQCGTSAHFWKIVKGGYLGVLGAFDVAGPPRTAHENDWQDCCTKMTQARLGDWLVPTICQDRFYFSVEMQKGVEDQTTVECRDTVAEDNAA